MTAAPPDRLGEYEILGELGRGAMGVVWRGRKPAMPDREVAIKEVPVGPDSADRNRKLREARTLLRVDSVHIVALHDVFEVPERGSLCFVMERLRSKTLRDRATSLGAGMEVDDAIETLDAILDALEAAHGATDETGTPRTPTGSVRDSCGGIGPSPVGSRPDGATPEGVQDMAGNLWEWVDDPASPDSATRPVRGGTWGSPAAEIGATSRSAVGRNEARPGVGFRCAR